MIHLVTQAEVEDRMGLTAGSANATILSALNGAHLRVQTELESRLERPAAPLVEHFYLDRTKTSGVIPDGMFRLKLRNGFLRADPTVAFDSLLAGEYVDTPSGVKFDKVRGLIYVPAEYDTYYLRVTYDHGFVVGESAPDEIKEAVLGLVPVIVSFSGPRGDKEKAGNRANYEAACDHALAVLSPIRRKLGFTLAPVF